MSRRGWIAALLSLILLDLWAAYVRREGTLSQEIRALFRTHTPAGRIRLCVAWAALTAWVLPHWCRWPDDRPHL